MKNFLILCILMTIVSCGKGGGSSSDSPEIGSKDTDGFVSVAQATITISNEQHISYLNKALNTFNPIQSAYAAVAPLATISYTYSPTGSITLGNLSAANETNPDLVTFGAVSVTSFDSNDLRKCDGAGGPGTLRCTKAKIRAYVDTRSSNFNAFGAKLKIGNSFLSENNGVLNATDLVVGNISSNRIRTSPTSQNPFQNSVPALSNLGLIGIDLSDASAGAFTVNVVVELAIGD